MTEATVGLRSRVDRVSELLRGRTDSEGHPLPGYKQNVAQIRAELAQLQEQIARIEDMNNGN